MSSDKKQGFKAMPLMPSSLAEVKAICEAHGIKNTVEYKLKYKGIPGLPAHPERVFKNDWESYTEFFELPQFKPYGELKIEVQKQNIKSKNDYLAWLNKIDDATYPRSPCLLYTSPSPRD